MNTLYILGQPLKKFPTLGQARRAFVNASLKAQGAALMRENGLIFEVTLNDVGNDKVVVKEFHKSTDAMNYILNMFNSH